MAGTIFNVGTLGEMNARVVRWARERVDTDLVNDAINDACQSLHRSVALATLSRFISPAIQLAIPSGATTVPVITIPDPTIPADVFTVAGGALPIRQASFAYTYATDSGSQTLPSGEVVIPIAAANLYSCRPPAVATGAIGWFLYAAVNGQLALQNVQPMAFSQTWLEPLAGILPAPNGPYPPYVNTTGDNIASIARLDIASSINPSILLPQDQSDITSELFTRGQLRLPSTSDYVRHAYDLVDNTRIEIRPAANVILNATLFYFVRPRRLRYPQSLLPFASFDGDQFINQQALSDVLLSLYEDEAAAGWQSKADKERERIVLSIIGENWNKNKRVKRYM